MTQWTGDVATRVFLNQTVYEAALERINWIFDEFPLVIVGWSGGKDSTVVFNLALKVATERGRLPLKVFFIDQEAEWQCVIDFTRLIMTRPDVEPWWFQMPIRLFNATSSAEPWLKCWEPGKVWMREKETFSKTVNLYGTDRFGKLFTAIPRREWGNTRLAYLAGVRTEESPSRFMACTSDPTYKGRTWGSVLDKERGHYTFYPLYDWSYKDIWKAIHENDWSYCQLYDWMYQYGVSTKDMRVSNVHHETAVASLWFMQELEPGTWSKLTERLAGISATGHLQKDSHRAPQHLPWMFRTWKEYRDHLLQNLIVDPRIREKMRRAFARTDARYGAMKDLKPLRITQIATVLANDWELLKLHNWGNSPDVDRWRKYVDKGIVPSDVKTNPYIAGSRRPRGSHDDPG